MIPATALLLDFNSFIAHAAVDGNQHSNSAKHNVRSSSDIVSLVDAHSSSVRLGSFLNCSSKLSISQILLKTLAKVHKNGLFFVLLHQLLT
jgi:hypothetical protein